MFLPLAEVFSEEIRKTDAKVRLIIKSRCFLLIVINVLA
tara:strand:- start:904 stop:1020 length:117 start_codon:yes stop_codon:yes gene_type:complete